MNEFTFTDSRFMTAQEKRRVIKAWSRFLKGGCALKDFTSALYEHLIQHCDVVSEQRIYRPLQPPRLLLPLPHPARTQTPVLLSVRQEQGV
ncbi:MAG: hypothetical protein GY832_40140 [Chloroflexi bacterium]|nr:hypothetical protein [Chloroflexota bacterium]